MEVCDTCARHSWLVARLAGHLEQRRAEREVIREVLALPDQGLIDALGGLLAPVIREEYERVDPAEMRGRWDATGGWAVCRHSARYPLVLHDLRDVPSVLHGRGSPERLRDLLAQPAAAIVGARKASPEGRESARLLGRGASAAGVTVVSGMALGIDSAAHEGTMEAGANTIAVLACGPDVPYPRSRRDLHGRMVQRAAVVSELPPGTPPYRWAFPARNRIIAALARMTVIVEAAERSGSLITTDIAIDLGRDVAAVPGAPLNWRCAGSNALLRDGAIVVRDAVDLIDSLAGTAPDGLFTASTVPPGAAPVPEGLPERLLDLLQAIDGGADSVDHHAATSQAARAVLADLTELELLGLVARRPGGRYARTAG